ncbi:TniB family NTP-binding protein [Pseudarthrobacter sp. NBSH8]|uniref:TniB family NTP-binding protein n=1 Tax=Pseudarthrobacter sp. NBSH8 TaxID=2596911 RepID=UPI00162A1768|nr:TniB family NTP-binding protein [Pseudarthrobacter sp. NBSH8]QNE14853.1 AAA family ATPase [Pseudarthrobacter sp. NBSH8]
MTEDLFQQLRKPENDSSLMNWISLSRVLGPGREHFTPADLLAYEAMDLDRRARFNEARVKFMAGGMIVKTDTISGLIRLFTKASLMNDGSLVGRRGVILSAPASSGKSTACVALMQYYLASYEKENPGAIAEGTVPVIYVSIPATRTIKGTLQRIARFLAVPFKTSDTETDLAAMLQHVLPAVGTKLIVLDEVQMLRGAESTSRPAVNNLKDLTNYFEGTIVYSGVNLGESGLLLGDAGLQLKRRVFNVNVSDFTGKMTAQKADEWVKVVGAFAKALPLYATNPETLRAEAEWLHDYTGGSIGTLKAVLFDAAASLILQDEPRNECLTRACLESSIRDYSAELGDTRVYPSAPLRGAAKRAKVFRTSV